MGYEGPLNSLPIKAHAYPANHQLANDLPKVGSKFLAEFSLQGWPVKQICWTGSIREIRRLQKGWVRFRFE